MKQAFLFPGQAAQRVGMMTDMIAEYQCIRRTLERVSDETSTDIVSLCLTADETTLNDGKLSGLLVVASSVAILHLARERGLSAEAYAGYSVGQYAALYASGILTLEDMFKILIERQEALDAAATTQPSCMIAVLGVPIVKVAEIVAKFEGAAISNFNCPNNYSVACRQRDVEPLIAHFIEAEAVRAIRLPVAGGWHSHFMLPAANSIKASLSSLNLKAADGLFIENVSGRAMAHYEELPNALYEHVYRPVQWELSMRSLFDSGCSTFFELGYGEQLSKFVKFCDRRKQALPMGTVQRFEQALSSVNL